MENNNFLHFFYIYALYCYFFRNFKGWIASFAHTHFSQLRVFSYLVFVTLRELAILLLLPKMSYCYFQQTVVF